MPYERPHVCHLLQLLLHWRQLTHWQPPEAITLFKIREAVTVGALLITLDGFMKNFEIIYITSFWRSF